MKSQNITTYTSMTSWVAQPIRNDLRRRRFEKFSEKLVNFYIILSGESSESYWTLTVKERKIRLQISGTLVQHEEDLWAIDDRIVNTHRKNVYSRRSTVRSTILHYTPAWGTWSQVAGVIR